MNTEWTCVVMAKTHRPDGRLVRMRRVVKGSGDVVGAMRAALMARRDKGQPFAGCSITAITPLGQRVIRVFDPDTGELVQ